MGINNPAFGVAIVLTFIEILDAGSLRRQVGKHAAAINKLSAQEKGSTSFLRERVGHTRFEILAGVFTGAAVAYFVNCL